MTQNISIEVELDLSEEKGTTQKQMEMRQKCRFWNAILAISPLLMMRFAILTCYKK
ncbi:hypothetical protein ACNR9V_01005 [Parageobacillus thermoglucosidasius]|uniref:hypothetical protein n=1 Tax=Parageobacillus thermoglucosidasius TaxID=1426 RepID=UPI003B685D72